MIASKYWTEARLKLGKGASEDTIQLSSAKISNSCI